MAKPKTLFIRGNAITVETAEFTSGDGEGRVWGYYERLGRRIVLDKSAQDDLTLGHEVGHAIADAVGVYMNEEKMTVFEEFVAMCRDPRNKWFVDYLKGE